MAKVETGDDMVVKQDGTEERRYFVKFYLPKDIALHPQFLVDLESFLTAWLKQNG